MTRRAGLALIVNLLLIAADPCGAVNSAAPTIDRVPSLTESGAGALLPGAAPEANSPRASSAVASEDDCGDCGGGGGGGQGDRGPERGGTGQTGASDLWTLGVLAVFVALAPRTARIRALRRGG